MTGGPPRITRVQTSNFRALRSLDVRDIHPLTVLVGPNGSGKSTFFDVFAFLSDCFTSGIRAACDSRGGLGNIRSRGADGPVAVAISYRETPRAKLITYRLELDEQQGRPYVAHETLTWTTAPAQGRPRNIIDFSRGAGRVWDETTFEESSTTLTDDMVLAVNALGQIRAHPRVEALRNFISGWHMSYLSVDDERAVPPAGPQERLSRRGDNLSNVLQFLREQHPERLRMIIAALGEAIPTLGEVKLVESPDGRLVLQVRDEPFESPVLARFVSDGTLKMLAYLVLLENPDPAPFIGIEEPENFLYPTLLEGLADRCRDAAKRSQIVVTTHSHDFVNACLPKEVIALYRERDGYTRAIRPSELRNVNAMMDNGAELGWLWRQGYFEPLPEPTGGSTGVRT